MIMLMLISLVAGGLVGYDIAHYNKTEHCVVQGLGGTYYVSEVGCEKARELAFYEGDCCSE